MLAQFEFENKQIRFVDGYPVANDVAQILGYTNPRDAVYRLVKEKNKRVCKTQTLRYGENKPRIEEITVLEEAGIYQLIFGSKLPIADKFQDWVFEEVLPSIRKTGSYSIIQQPPKKAITYYGDRILNLKDCLKKPADTWCVIEKCGHLLLEVERLGYKINQFDLLDASVGRQWSSYRSGKPWALEVKKAKYIFKDKRPMVYVNAFDYAELSYFGKWLDSIYEVSKMPIYLKDKYGALVTA